MTNKWSIGANVTVLEMRMDDHNNQELLKLISKEEQDNDQKKCILTRKIWMFTCFVFTAAKLVSVKKVTLQQTEKTKEPIFSSEKKYLLSKFITTLICWIHLHFKNDSFFCLKNFKNKIVDLLLLI